MEEVEPPQEVVTIQQWSTQKAQLFWFLDPVEFIIAVALVLFFPFIAWQFGVNLVAMFIPGAAYMTILILTKMGKRRGYLDQLTRYYLRSKIWHPTAYENAIIHEQINPDLDIRSTRHLYDPNFHFPSNSFNRP